MSIPSVSDNQTRSSRVQPRIVSRAQQLAIDGAVGVANRAANVYITHAANVENTPLINVYMHEPETLLETITRASGAALAGRFIWSYPILGSVIVAGLFVYFLSTGNPLVSSRRN